MCWHYLFSQPKEATIVGGPELNFCVRDGNRWTLKPINTNCADTGNACSDVSRLRGTYMIIARFF